MSIIENVRINQNWKTESNYKEPDRQQNKFSVEGWDKEFAAIYIEKLLDVQRRQGTMQRLSVTGEPYIVFAGTGIKEEGELIKGWKDNEYKAWVTFCNTIMNHYSDITPNHKIYWRWLPELDKWEGKFVVGARLLVSDKEIAP